MTECRWNGVQVTAKTATTAASILLVRTRCRSARRANAPATARHHIDAAAPQNVLIIIIITINNSHDNVYGAVIMTKVIARVYPVYLTNAD